MSVKTAVRIPGLVHHEQYLARPDIDRLHTDKPIERLVISADDNGLRIELQRMVSIGYYSLYMPVMVHEEWVDLTAFDVHPENLRNSADLWMQAWMYTGKREYGERVPEA